MDKKALRAEIKEKKLALTPAQIEAASADLLRQLLASPLYREAPAIYGYLSYNQEVRTLPILQQALKDGKRVAVPKVFGDRMEFLYLTDLSQIAPGYRGIPEPIADGPLADEAGALVLMPGLAFDRAGNRCGYGGGFYDRYLSEHPGHKTIALCFDFQMGRCLCTEAHDIPVDAVLSAPV